MLIQIQNTSDKRGLNRGGAKQDVLVPPIQPNLSSNLKRFQTDTSALCVWFRTLIKATGGSAPSRRHKNEQLKKLWQQQFKTCTVFQSTSAERLEELGNSLRSWCVSCESVKVHSTIHSTKSCGQSDDILLTQLR